MNLWLHIMYSVVKHLMCIVNTIRVPSSVAVKGRSLYCTSFNGKIANSISEVGWDGIELVSNIKLCDVSFATVVSS